MNCVSGRLEECEDQTVLALFILHYFSGYGKNYLENYKYVCADEY